jgi:hypothetical protein
MTAKCLWIESSNFARHRLLGIAITCPRYGAGRSVTPGQHFLVPLKHVESLTAAEDEVWEEIQRFKVVCEPVLPRTARMSCL